MCLARVPGQEPVSNKAAERLHQFEQERGLEQETEKASEERGQTEAENQTDEERDGA